MTVKMKENAHTHRESKPSGYHSKVFLNSFISSCTSFKWLSHPPMGSMGKFTFKGGPER